MGSTQRIDICQIVYKLITLLIMPTGAQTQTQAGEGGGRGGNRTATWCVGATAAYSKFSMWMQNVVRTSYVM